MACIRMLRFVDFTVRSIEQVHIAYVRVKAHLPSKQKRRKASAFDFKEMLPSISTRETVTVSLNQVSIAALCMGARWLWKLGGQINKTGGAQSKFGEAPMVKFKDFTLASQIWGGIWPPVPYTPGAHGSVATKAYLNRRLWRLLGKYQISSFANRCCSFNWSEEQYEYVLSAIGAAALIYLPALALTDAHRV